jgi:hypothetical protein
MIDRVWQSRARGRSHKRYLQNGRAKGVNIHIYGHFCGHKLISNPVTHKVVDAGCISRCVYGLGISKTGCIWPRLYSVSPLPVIIVDGRWPLWIDTHVTPALTASSKPNLVLDKCDSCFLKANKLLDTMTQYHCIRMSLRFSTLFANPRFRLLPPHERTHPTCTQTAQSPSDGTCSWHFL